MLRKKTFNTRLLLIAFSFLSACCHLNAQVELRGWAGLNADMKLSKKTSAGLGHLRSYTASGNFKNGFNQTSLDISHDLRKNVSVKAGITLTELPLNGEMTTRYYIRGTYKTKLGSLLRWSNGIQLEKHSASETRFSERVIIMSRLGLKERLAFLNLSPSVSYWLYYNIGGEPLQYYDKTGNPSALQTPDGFHRGRLTLNLNSKINKALSVSVYYMAQREFNLFTPGERELNVVNPANGKIKRPFNDFNVAGISLNLGFDLYKRNK